MLSEKFRRLSANSSLFSIILIVNSFVWLSLVSKILREIVNIAAFSDFVALMVWSVNFCGAVVSIVIGAFLTNRVHQRTRFLLFWTLFGIISSIAPLFIGITTIGGALAVSALFSASLGLGLPACMAEFADHTAVENRARRSGITLLLMAVLGALIASLITADIMTSSLVLACWKGLSLVAFFFVSSNKSEERKMVKVSFTSIVRERSFVAYMIPWVMFSLVNYLSAPISVNIHGEELISFLTSIGNVLTGVFAIVGGFLSDIIGRKRITITGFIMLGIGYAILGIYPLNIFCLYFYTVVDGIAWGIFYVIFFFTIWGDLAYGKPSEKYYALGSLPYILSNFLRISVGPFIANTISAYAVFSFAAFFLFLAVIPLMYAPETLPEKQIRERELKTYIEKAKKVKEKYA
jgi:MFS family permease